MDVYAIEKIREVEPVRPLSQFVLRRKGRLASGGWLLWPRQFYSTIVVPGERGAELHPCWALHAGTLTVVGGGGAPLPATVGERLHGLTGLRYQEGYGLAETISQTHVNPPDRPKLQCLGAPHFDVDARIVNPEMLEDLGRTMKAK